VRGGDGPGGTRDNRQRRGAGRGGGARERHEGWRNGGGAGVGWGFGWGWTHPELRGATGLFFFLLFKAAFFLSFFLFFEMGYNGKAPQGTGKQEWGGVGRAGNARGGSPLKGPTAFSTGLPFDCANFRMRPFDWPPFSPRPFRTAAFDCGSGRQGLSNGRGVSSTGQALGEGSPRGGPEVGLEKARGQAERLDGGRCGGARGGIGRPTTNFHVAGFCRRGLHSFTLGIQKAFDGALFFFFFSSKGWGGRPRGTDGAHPGTSRCLVNQLAVWDTMPLKEGAGHGNWDPAFPKNSLFVFTYGNPRVPSRSNNTPAVSSSCVSSQ